jgi:predicted RND superfamily exporter protein
VEQDKAIVVVEQKEIARQKKLMEQWHRLRNEIMQLPEVKEVLKSFVALLKRQGSMAATHRLLKEANLDYYSLATFRKKWPGPEKWTEGNLSPNNLKTVMGLLSIKNDQVLEEVAKLDELWEAANAPLQSIGEPVYVKG